MPALPNPRHEHFCQVMAKGQSSASAAYLSVYGEEVRSPDSCASRLAAKGKIKARIEELRALYLTKFVLSLSEKRAFLRSVVNTPVGEVDENSPLAQQVKRRSKTTRNGDEETEVEIKLPDKLRAIELDAKLAGELSDRPPTGPLVSLNFIASGSAKDQVIDLSGTSTE